jgi:hypothetical protein
MAAPLDLTAARLEAARNTGITVEFRRAQGRDFTGSVADYARLDQGQQLRLTAELSRLLERARLVTPEVAAKLDASGTAVSGTGRTYEVTSPALLQLTTGDVLRRTGESIAELPQTLNRAVVAATGGTLSSLLTKGALILGLLVGGYLVITYAPRPARRP